MGVFKPKLTTEGIAETLVRPSPHYKNNLSISFLFRLFNQNMKMFSRGNYAYLEVWRTKTTALKYLLDDERKDIYI